MPLAHRHARAIPVAVRPGLLILDGGGDGDGAPSIEMMLVLGRVLRVDDGRH